ncbi:organic cation transporter protein [Trichonephila clavipes]|nr:organic cation transporter protein [Trichonephila clavipes]
MAVSQKSEEKGYKEYIEIIGGSGWFQIVICIFCFFCAAAHCLHDFTMTFFAPNMDHWCARPPEVLRANISVEEWKNLVYLLLKVELEVNHIANAPCIQTLYITVLYTLTPMPA